MSLLIHAGFKVDLKKGVLRLEWDGGHNIYIYISKAFLERKLKFDKILKEYCCLRAAFQGQGFGLDKDLAKIRRHTCRKPMIILFSYISNSCELLYDVFLLRRNNTCIAHVHMLKCMMMVSPARFVMPVHMFSLVAVYRYSPMGWSVFGYMYIN